MHIPKFNPIRSVTSPIFTKEIFKIRAIAKSTPVHQVIIDILVKFNTDKPQLSPELPPPSQACNSMQMAKETVL